MTFPCRSLVEVSLAVVVGLLPSVASAGVIHRATLSAPPTVGAPLGPVAAAGPNVLAASPGGVYVFTKPATGWADAGPSAVLTDSGGASVEPSDLAIDGNTAVVPEEQQVNPQSYDDVFVEPVGGWAGLVHESARLAASDGSGLGEPSISGATIVSVGQNPRTGVNAVYVFTEPAGGWSGTIHETARLMDGGGDGVAGAIVAGRTIFVASRGHGDVFAEPAQGWRTVRGEQAVLTDPDLFYTVDGMSVSGRSLFAGSYVFREPRAGWRGSVQPAAFLYQAQAPGLVPGSDQVSGPIVAIPASSGSDTGVWLYSEPARGWTGTRSAVPFLGFPKGFGVESVAFSGPDLFAGGPASVGVYEITGSFGRQARTPVLDRVSLTGMGSGRPRLAFDLRAGADAPPLRAFTLTLPRGLTFRSLRQVKAHLRILHAGRWTGLKLRLGHLIVTPLVPAARFAVTLHPAALVEADALARPRASHHHETASGVRDLHMKLRVDIASVGGAMKELTRMIAVR